MALLQNLYGNPVVHGLGWSLVHACWQILLIASIFYLLRPRLDRISASATYLGGIISLSIILGWSGITFWQQCQFFDDAISTAQLVAVPNNTSAVVVSSSPAEQIAVQAPAVKEESSLDWRSILLYVLPLVVVVWALGTVLLLVRLFLDWYRIYRMRKEGLQQVNERWLEIFEVLKSKLDIPAAVRLYLSEKVIDPLTFGFMKPMVLVPLGFFSQLSPAMVEMVLLHELAHIKRGDYLVNFLQSIVEIIYFFHPAIWWIGGVIRQSREHACDDIAVAASQNPLLYAQTLTHLQSRHLLTKNNLAMSLSGTTGSFTTRIKRLFHSNELPKQTGGNLLFSSVLVGCLLFFAFAKPFDSEAYPSPLPNISEDGNAVMFVITPASKQQYLQQIESTLDRMGVRMDYSEIKYTAFGLIDHIKIDFQLADLRTFTMEAGGLHYVYISVDPSKADPLDVRFACSSMTVHPPEKDNESAWAMSRPYTTSLSSPAGIGDIYFQETEGWKVELIIPVAESALAPIYLNGKLITKEHLLAKDIQLKDIQRIVKLTPAQAAAQLEGDFPMGAYLVSARIVNHKKTPFTFPSTSDQSSSSIYDVSKKVEEGAFFSTPSDPATQYTFTVLHKAEVRALNGANLMGKGKKRSFTISDDNCQENEKALHILNDQILEVPEGACYPPALLELPEVDSFFLYDTDLAQQQFGVNSAYVFYYQYNKDDSNRLVDEISLPKINRAIMNDIQLADITFKEEIPTSILNGELLSPNKDGGWPAALTQYEVFDSVVILMVADLKQAYGLNTEKHVLHFYGRKEATKENINSESPAAILPQITPDQVQVNPNPFKDRLRITLNLNTEAMVKVQVYDQAGKQMADLTDGILSKGKHTVFWNTEPAIAAGTYYVSVQIGEAITSLPVILLGAQ